MCPPERNPGKGVEWAALCYTPAVWVLVSSPAPGPPDAGMEPQMQGRSPPSVSSGV